MAETEGMMHRERKVNIITTILEGTAFKRSYFNKLQTFCKETLSLNVAEHYSIKYIYNYRHSKTT